MEEKCILSRSMGEKGEHGKQMSEIDNHQGNPLQLQRVRCSQCRLPLIQLYQGDLRSTLQQHGEEIASQQLPAYSYRILTNPTPLLVCRRCDAVLSPATVAVVLHGTTITEEGKKERRVDHL